MLTHQEAEGLLRMPKWIVAENGELSRMDNCRISAERSSKLLHFSGKLLAEDDETFFLLVVKQGKKRALKLSLHHQEHEAHIALLRVDYSGGHQNPSTWTNAVPEKFHPYVAKWFGFDEPHIHYYVEGYKTLAWALPLINDNFPVKQISEGDDIGDAIRAFGRAIALQTNLLVDRYLF